MPNKKTYRIVLEGCDDSTVFDMELTNEEFDVLKRVSDRANETSYYRCMPRMYIDLIECQDSKEVGDGES